MKRAVVLMAACLALPAFAAAENWSNVSMIDTQCSTKAKADPDAHTKACAMACAKSGFGIIDSGGNYLKFDAKGNLRDWWTEADAKASAWMFRERRTGK